jgi:hypothetical protein
VRITLPSRRAAGLLAVSTIGFSTAVLGVTDVASAVPAVLGPVVITSEDGYSASSDDATGITIDPGYCTAYAQVVGGQGGEDAAETAGGPAGEVDLVMPVTADQEFSFSVGSAASGGAHGVNADESSFDGTDGTDGSGGGGAGSALVLDGSPVVTAAGGDGTGAGHGTGGGVTGHTVGPVDGFDVFSGSTADAGGSEWNGNGLVYVGVTGCDAPYAPAIDSVETGDTSATFTFWPTERDDFTAAADGYQYRLDGGTWTSLTSTEVTGGKRSATITGLTTGHEYDLELRAVSDHNGESVASDAKTFTPIHVIGAPENVTATVGVSTVTINWQPPSGETGIAGYSAWAAPEGAQSSGGTVFCADMSHNATARSCTVVVPAGIRYNVTVQADDGARADWVLSDVVPAPAAPATLPESDGPLGTGSTTLTAGKDVTLTGAGFLPGSTVTLVIYSTPTPLGTVVAADGTFSSAVTLPASLPNGVHHLVAAGLDASGNPYYLVTEVTITGGTAASTSGSTSGSLAYTGFSALPYVGGGALALVAGAGLIVASRRRARA